MRTEIQIKEYEVLPHGGRPCGNSEFRWARVTFETGQWLVHPYRCHSRVYLIEYRTTKREADKAARAWVVTGKWAAK
jgi:hypothetical protein